MPLCCYYYNCSVNARAVLLLAASCPSAERVIFFYFSHFYKLFLQIDTWHNYLQNRPKARRTQALHQGMRLDVPWSNADHATSLPAWQTRQSSAWSSLRWGWLARRCTNSRLAKELVKATSAHACLYFMHLIFCEFYRKLNIDVRSALFRLIMSSIMLDTNS